MLSLSQCTETCGWVAALLSALSFGTYGVPLKSKASMKHKTDPLVVQTYQTVVCFLMCWMVPLAGITIKFSKWGLLSGLCWVPGSTLGVYAIRAAGLAVSVGTWSSMIVMVSFTWGIFVFKENVKSVMGAIAAASLLIVGLCGMSNYSAPIESNKYVVLKHIEEGGGGEKEDVVSGSDDTSTLPSTSLERSSVPPVQSNAKKRIITSNDKIQSQPSDDPYASMEMEPLEMEPLVDAERDESSSDGSKFWTIKGISFTKRQVGLACAVFNGVWGGSNLIPFHYARNEGISGLEYAVSFGTGSLLILTLLWLLRYTYHLLTTKSFHTAYQSLPSFHFHEMWISSSLAGAFFSIGKLFSILSVTYLGQGVGYSLTQSSMLISGIWGIFYFEEIVEEGRIRMWFGSAFLTVAGILWLSYEHQSGR